MSTFTRYILKRCIFAIAYTIFAMGFVLILPHVEPLIRSLAIGQISFGEFWYMWIRLYPMIFYIQMPLIVAFSIGLVYFLMARDKELVAFLGSGAAPMRVAAPGIIAAVFGGLICAMLSLYLLPVSILEFKEMAFVASKRIDSKALNAGKFNSVYGGYTIYFRNRDEGGVMHELIIKDGSKPGSSVIITANRGFLKFDKDDIAIVLFDGNIQRTSAKTGFINLVDFNILRYPIGKRFQYESPVGRSWGYFERHIGELVNPSKGLGLSSRQRAEWMMEGHKRIINPVMCIGYGILVIAFICWANSRVRNSYWVIPLSLVVILGIHVFYIVFLSAYVKFAANLPAVLYGVPVAVLFDGMILFYFISRERSGAKGDKEKKGAERAPMALG